MTLTVRSNAWSRLDALLSLPTWLWCVAVMCLGPVGLALFSQHVFGHEPCPWCILQRVVFVAMALVAVAAAPVKALWVQRLALVVVMALAASGSAASLWQHFVAAASQSCNLTLAEKIIHGLWLDTYLPEVFEPRANCADAKFYFLGVPYEFWALGLYVSMFGLSLRAVFKSMRG